MPRFEGKNFAYWKVRMASYLEAISPECWQATSVGFEQPFTEQEVRWNAKAKNAIFEGISEEVFSRVRSKEFAHDIWVALCEIHEGSRRIREERYHVLMNALNQFKMFPNELCNDMYSRMNMLVEEINSLELTQLSDGDVIRRILMVLPKPQYNIVISLLHERDINDMTITDAVGKICAHEMFLFGDHESSSKKNLALKAKMVGNKKKKIKLPSSSSESDEDDDNDEHDDDDSDTELALLMRRTTRMISKFQKKGYNYDPKKNKFRPKKFDKFGGGDKKKCYNCGNLGHISYDCPHPDKRNKNKSKKLDASEDEDKYKKKDQDMKKKKLFNKRGGGRKAYIVGEWVSGESSSDDSSDNDDNNFAGLAIVNDDPPLPPPPMCLMAKGNNKVSSEEDDSSDDNGLSPNDLSKLMNDYAAIIKRQKAKIKLLENANSMLSSKHDELLTKHNNLLGKYDEVVESNKSLKASNYKLKLEHDGLIYKHQELEYAYDAIDRSLDELVDNDVVKVNASTSCDDLLDISCDITSSSKTNHAREKELQSEIASLKSCVARLTKGEYKHKEILMMNALYFNKKGLGCFPNPVKRVIKTPEIKNCFIKEVGSYCQHCQVTGHHTRECPIPTKPLPILPSKYKSTFNDHHFLLHKLKNGKIMAKFIGTQAKGKLPRQLWVPKSLVSHIKGTKLGWVPKQKA